MVGGRRPQYRPRPAYYHNMAGQLRPAALHQQYFQHAGYLGHVDTGHAGYLGHVDSGHEGYLGHLDSGHAGYLGYHDTGHAGYLGHVDNSVDTVYPVSSHAADTPASYPDTHVGSISLLA